MIFTLVFILFSSCQLFLGAEHDTSPQGVLTNLWNDFNIIHAYIDIRMSDNGIYSSWEDVLNNKEIGYKKKLSEGLPLFDACGLMLRELGDPHVGLYGPGKFFYSLIPNDVLTERGWYTLRSNNIQRQLYLQGPGGLFSADRDSMFLYGLFNEPYENIGYIHIRSFSDSTDFGGIQDWVAQINGIITYLNNTDAIILDIRNNDGGSTANMEYIAARFADGKTDYLKISTKRGPGRNDFTAPVTYSIQSGGTTYNNKPVILLTNKASVSAAEWFTLALREQDHVQHMGTATRGALSARMARPMINGWYYTISADKVEDKNGICYEGVGIRPEKTEYIITGVWEEWEERGNRDDRQLNKALEWLELLL